MDSDIGAQVIRVLNGLVHDVVQLRQELAALRSAYAAHTHQENTAATYVQNATTAEPGDPGPEIQGVHSEYV